MMNTAYTLKSTLKRSVQKDSISYSVPISILSQSEIREAQEWFDDAKQKGLITSGAYYDNAWYMTDEVHKSVKLSFKMNEVLYMKNSREALGCTFEEYQDAMRVYIRLCMGYALNTIKAKVRVLVRLGEKLSVTGAESEYETLCEFLALLPCNSDMRDRLLAESEEKTENTTLLNARNIATYQSAFRLDYYLDVFWEEAEKEEKLLYFPVWFWWKISSVMPLRATECVLTPRQCVWENDGKYYLRLRRTLQKSRRGEARYNIEDDYEKCDYPIPKQYFDVISWYIRETEETYKSDIDILFSKQTQFQYADVRAANDNHYTVENLAQSIYRFYAVLRDRYHLDVLGAEEEVSALTNNKQICRLLPGDTRHLAIINLIITTNNIRVAQELAKHNSINSTFNYYQNADLYLRAIQMDLQIAAPPSRRNQQFNIRLDDIILDPAHWVDVTGGKCCNRRYAEGKYDDCTTAVDVHGTFSCKDCRFFRSKAVTNLDATDHQLAESCTMLRYAIESVRSEKGKGESLAVAISRVQTDALSRFDQLAMQAYSERSPEIGEGC